LSAERMEGAPRSRDRAVDEACRSGESACDVS
jgi:hypothetical protein